jgi:hypothetical protein
MQNKAREEAEKNKGKNKNKDKGVNKKLSSIVQDKE